MSFYVISGPSRSYYRDLWESNDAAFIEDVVTQGNASEKEDLSKNPHLTDKQVEILANDSAEYVRAGIAKRENLPTALLTKLLTDPSEEVRVYALCNPATDISYFEKTVLNEKFSNTSKQQFCDELKVLESIAVFEFLWKNTRNSHKALTYNLGRALSGYRDNDPAKIDPNCVEVIHDEIRNDYGKGKTSKVFREEYAYQKKVSTIPEILDMLKKDTHRPVINNIARNPNAWVETHAYLVQNHKTPDIRMAVARATKDNTLLNEIYHGTKSEQIREAVRENPVFVNKRS